MNQSRPLPTPRRTPYIHDLTRRVRQATADVLGDHADAAVPPLRVSPAPSALTPRRMAMAQASDPATREQLTASYQAALDCYRRLAGERLGEDGSDDVGAAVAFYVAVNLHALHGVNVAADALVPLENQLRAVTKLVANWDHAGTAERQSFFERIAIVAILVSGAASRAAALHDESARAEVRRNAHSYLQQLLGVDPEQMTLDAHGLVLRDPAPTA